MLYVSCICILTPHLGQILSSSSSCNVPSMRKILLSVTVVAFSVFVLINPFKTLRDCDSVLHSELVCGYLNFKRISLLFQFLAIYFIFKLFVHPTRKVIDPIFS